MPASGKKRSRKAEEDASKKKQKAGGEQLAKKEAASAVGALAQGAPIHAVARKETPNREASLPVKALTPQIAKEPEDEDTLGNPYEQTRAWLAKKQETPAKKETAPVVADSPPPAKITNETSKSKSVVLNGVNVVQPSVTKKRTNPTSVPCILLFLVAILMWCTVTLLGLLLSERMEHELQVWHLRNMVNKAAENPQVNELQQDVKHWKGVAQKLESQKKGMLQEFGEKLATLEYME